MRLFVRNLRKDKIESKNYLGYSIFALVEVFLIVIGIFLATKIDNNNKLDQSESEVKTLLAEIQNNLSDDIKASNKIFYNYIDDNRILDKVYDPEISRDEVAQLSTSIDRFIRFYLNFEITTDGYTALKDVSDIVPDNYMNLYKDISLFYKREKNFDVYNKRCQKTIYEYQDYLIAHQPWFNRDNHYETISDEQIDYYFQSPKVKSQIGMVIDDVSELYLITSNYRKAAIDLYISIEKTLGSDSKLSSGISYTCLDVALLQTYVGNYQCLSGTQNNPVTKKASVDLRDGKLLFQDQNMQPASLFSLNDSIFFFDKAYDLVIFHDGSNMEIVNHGIQKDDIYKKAN